jgi:hypothetical protein
MKMKKLIAIAAIFLFIGVAVAPGINSSVVKTSDNNDFVEVTSQVCGIQGFGNTTVKLTKQQYQDLENYLVDFRARLNQTTTREEAVPLFKDAVVELNKYGLLPKGMSVEKAQKLVTIGNRMKNVPSIVKKISTLNSINYLCLITGIFQEPIDVNIWTRIAVYFFKQPYYLWPLTLAIAVIFMAFAQLKPLHFMNDVYIAGFVRFFFSVGAGGIKVGFGGLKLGHYNISEIVGFTGLKILFDVINWDAFYLGFALDVYDKY